MKTFDILSVLFVILILSCSNPRSNQSSQDKETDTTNLKKIEIGIIGMTCNGCEQTIQGKIAELPGIQSVVASYQTKNAVVEYNPALVDSIKIAGAIEASGYKPIGFSIIKNDSISN